MSTPPMPQSSPPAHAGIHFPPPFIYVGALVIGWLLNRWRPIPITTGPSTGRMIVAVIFVAAYIAIFASAFGGFRRARTTLIPNQPATALVTTGIYRLTRNPMYLSLLALYLGLALFLNSWWPVFLVPLLVLLVDRRVIAKEERYLGAVFPTDYDAYRARVRRWV